MTVALETGILAMREPETIVRVDTAAGPVRARATCRDGKCVSVEFANVPSLVDRLDATLEIEGLGSVVVDIAYGGMWYAITDATRLGFRIEPRRRRATSPPSAKRSAWPRARNSSVVHPENPDIAGRQHRPVHTGPSPAWARSRAIPVIVAPGRSDRSPTGTGTCARMAVLHARGAMKVGDSMVHESIIGSRFTGRIAGTTTVAGRPAILPTIEGRAWITGLASEMLDPTDPYPTGYVLADTWGVSGTTSQ